MMIMILISPKYAPPPPPFMAQTSQPATMDEGMEKFSSMIKLFNT